MKLHTRLTLTNDKTVTVGLIDLLLLLDKIKGHGFDRATIETIKEAVMAVGDYE